MKKLKVKATKKQITELTKLFKNAQTTPVIAMSSAEALSGNDWSSRAWNRLYEKVNEYAHAAGLPKIKENYGIDLTTGQFMEI